MMSRRLVYLHWKSVFGLTMTFTTKHLISKYHQFIFVLNCIEIITLIKFRQQTIYKTLCQQIFFNI